MSESGEDIWENVGSASINHDRAGQMNILRAVLNAAQEGTEFGEPTRFQCKKKNITSSVYDCTVEDVELMT